MDASECPPTVGSDPDLVRGVIAGGNDALTRSREGAEDDSAAGARAMDDLLVGPEDVVVGIAASGTTAYVNASIVRAKQRGARTVFVACTDPPDRMVRLVTRSSWRRLVRRRSLDRPA